MVWPTGMSKCPVSPEDRGETDLGPHNEAFHNALRMFPDEQSFKALHYFWNEAFAGQPQDGAALAATRAASQTPMVADIAQIILSGHANGKTRFEIAEDVLREFSLSRHRETPHDNI